MLDQLSEKGQSWPSCLYFPLQSLGCTLYAMAYKESPFEKVYQRGDSIALAVMSDTVRFPTNTG